MWEKIISYIPEWKVFMQGFIVFFIPYFIFKLFNGLISKQNTNDDESVKIKGQTAQKVKLEHQTEKSSKELYDYYTGDFNLDVELVKKEIGHNWDVHFREFHIGNTNVRAAIIFLDGLSDKELIDKHILSTLMGNFQKNDEQEFFMKKESFYRSLLNMKFFPLVT